MEEINILKKVFNNYLSEDESKYIITNKENIMQLINIFDISNNNSINNNCKYDADKIILILNFMEESFNQCRINADILHFNSINNNNIFLIFIDFYLYNEYNSINLDNIILDLIDNLIIHIDISKNIVDHILQKFSYYFYILNENENKVFPEKYKHFHKLLKLLIHIFGINYKQINPKCYYYLTEKAYITIPIFGNNTSIGITLWIKYYLINNEGEILAINLDKNNIIKLYIKDNSFIIECNEKIFNINIITNNKIFLSKNYNCISFNYKSIKKKWLINFYLNDRQILKDFCINDKPEKKIYVYYITIGKKITGELSTIIINNNTNFNIETQKNLLNIFPYGLTHYKNMKTFSENFKEIIPGLINIYAAYGGKYNLINNIKNDLIFENIDSLNNNLHIYKSFFKKIYLLGGIKTILPIIELFYTNIEICIKHKDLIITYIDLISTILKNNKKNMLDAMDNYFFMMLSVFIEKMPKNIFDNSLLDKLIELGIVIFNENKFCTLYLDYFNYILINENIFTKFNDELQIKLWENIYQFFEKSHRIICPINKIINILLNYDKNYIKGEEICCEDHFNCYIDDYKNIYKNKRINKPGFSSKTGKIFLLYEGILKYTKEKGNNDRIKYLIEMLALNISPCFIINILNLIKKLFAVEVNKKIKEETFNIINSNEDYKILIFNSLNHEFIDVKYYSLSLFLTIYDYNPKDFTISFKYIKNNILPNCTLNTYNYKNFCPTLKDITIFAKYCVDKIYNLNTFNIYNHDDIICSSIFNFSFIYLNYTKIINLFLSYINNNQENIYEILDILLYIIINLNIELTIELTNSINLYSVSNNILAKNIFTFIPLLNYFLSTILYYINFDNNVFSSIFEFFLKMIYNIKENKIKLVIIDYIIKYYSLVNNRGDKTKNKNIILNNNINIILNKLLNNISETYINKEILSSDYQFLINLISILFNYIVIFNQDKSLYNAYLSNNIKLLFPSFENEFSLLVFYLKGLNIESNSNIKNKENNKLNIIWKNYSIAQKIYDLVNENFIIYINKESFKDIKEKIQFLFDKLIFGKDILNNDNVVKIKKILYYVDDINKNFSLAQMIQIIYEIGIFLCKNTEDFEILINQYTNYILFIMIISIRIISENINNKKIPIETKLSDNDINSINQDIIFFSIIFFYETISLNPLLKNNDILKEIATNNFNEILFLSYLIYERGINSKKTEKIVLINTPAFNLFQYYFIKDENETNEKKNINYLKENKDNIDKLYYIILKDIFMQERFYNYGRFYKIKYSQRYINTEILMNCSKSRLENDTVEYSHKYIEKNNYVINFGNIKEKYKMINNKIKQDIKSNLNINSYETLKAKRNCYKSLKKKLFMFNGPWSNFDLFYKEKNKLKYKILNHYTKFLMRPFLSPILDLEYYMPKFDKLDYKKLFNNNEIEIPKYKNICLDIDKILNPNNDNNDYFEDYSFINDSDDKKYDEKNYICCFVKSTHHIKGLFYLAEQGIIFKVNKNIPKEDNEDLNYDDIKKTCFGSYFKEYPKDKDILHIAISFNKISYVFKRLYYYNETGLEIFTSSNKSYYFNFRSNEIRNIIYKVILTKLENKINKKNLDNIIHDWKEYSISNMELLMWLNIYSDRSYNDITQYPILPWILSNYSSEKIEEKLFSEITSENDLKLKDNLFRDLNLPLGMIVSNNNEERKNDYIKNLIYTTEQNKKNNIMLNANYALSEKPYNYGSHYSNPMYVTNFLFRLFPFSLILIDLQGNKFDDPDRLFISVQTSYYCSTNQKGDVRELIPEFYVIPEIYHNINNFDMGIRRNKEKVNDVKCPIWSGEDPHKFITLITMAFESDYVSSNINNWIDLIYGYKQRGKEGEKANNIFRFPSYADLVPIEQMNKDEKIYFFRFAEFGICPRQIFKKPFEKRAKLRKTKEIIDKNNMVITLNINDDKKNKTSNKKILAIFPLEKEGIKILYNDFTGIDFSKDRIKDNMYKYIKKHFSYGHGLILNDNLLGNSKIDMEQIPFVLYNNGKYLIEGGFVNGEMVISDLINYKGYLLFNEFDHSPVVNIEINKEETIGIVGNYLGIIYIYKVKDYFWDYKIKINIHNQKINYIYISNELNAFASCSDDNYINIFSLPSCKVLNSFRVQKPEISLLSSRPLAVCIIYSNENKELMVFGVNGKLIKKIEMNKKPKFPIIYINKYFRDYLIFSCDGKIFIYALPFLENINTIHLIPENLYYEFDLFLKYYKNESKDIENLIACDKNRQILYIIGDY